MCGRFTLSLSGDDLWQQLGLAGAPPDWGPRYNITPSQDVLAMSDAAAGVRHLRWGFVPGWAKDLKSGYQPINARSETASTKPMFRRAFREQRCVIFADGYYEWQRSATGKQPWFFSLPARVPFMMAGLWERWSGPAGAEIESCAILTRAASESVSEVHHRMPVIFQPDEALRWIECDAGSAETLIQTEALLTLESHPVSRLVNSPSNDRPECVARLSAGPGA